MEGALHLEREIKVEDVMDDGEAFDDWSREAARRKQCLEEKSGSAFARVTTLPISSRKDSIAEIPNGKVTHISMKLNTSSETWTFGKGKS